jgi:hypothetical protein
MVVQLKEYCTAILVSGGFSYARSPGPLSSILACLCGACACACACPCLACPAQHSKRLLRLLACGRGYRYRRLVL